jgi:hypothetical protein
LGVVAAVLLCLGRVAGCGGSSGPKAPAFDAAAAMTEVKTNWEAFFDPKNSNEARVALLEKGETLRQAVAAQSKNPLAKGSQTSVSTVVINEDHTTATVTYDISIGGNKVINGGIGKAVLEAGKWKVSSETFCGLANAGTPGTCPS